MLIISALQESIPWREVMPGIIIGLLPVLLPVFIGGVVCGIAGFMMLDAVDRGGVGFALGFFLGPIGLVIAWVQRDNGLREQEARRQRHHPIDDYLSNMKPPAPPPVAAPRQLSRVEELERLAALKERGHITDEEFNRRKAQLLGTPAPPRKQPEQRRFR